MIEIGKFNRLKVAKQHGKGFYLAGDDASDEVFLPLTEAESDTKVGDQLNVFVYVDAKNGLQATSKQPLAQVDEVAWLKVVSISHVGAFLDWGLSKDLLLPFNEQTQKIIEGRCYLVKVFLDEENRIAASMRLDDFIQDEVFYLKAGDQVDLIIADETELGFKAVANNEYWGLLYKNETFQKLRKGQKTRGYVKKIREDRRLDLVLQIAKYTEKVDSVTEKILSQLEKQDGVMLLNDKSSPELIYKTLGVSKKVFKQAIGSLYKKRIILINKASISLVKK